MVTVYIIVPVMDTTLLLTTIEAIAKILIMVAVGMLAVKVHILNEKETNALAHFVINITSPMLLLSCFFDHGDPERMKGFLIALALGALMHIISIILGIVLVKKGTPTSEVEKMGITYGNVAFMGIPLVNAMLGEEAVFYLSAIIIMFNLFIWSHGMILMRGSMSKKDLLHVLTTPSMICIFIGIFIYVFRIPIPDIVRSPITSIGSATTPVSMIVAGSIVIRSDLKAILKDKKTYLVSALRLIVTPLLLLLFIKVFHITGVVAICAYVASACPIASLVTMFALEYKKSPDYIAGLFALTTILSLATIPLMVMIYSLVG